MVDRFDRSVHVDPFREAWAFHDSDGYVAWRTGIGGGVEVLSLRAYSPGNGAGRRLLRAMLSSVVGNGRRPGTVYGFLRVPDRDGQSFYRSMGFGLHYTTGVYEDGEAVVFSAPFGELCRRHEIGSRELTSPKEGG